MTDSATTRSSESPATRTAARRPYTTPKLTVYGALAHITQAVGSKSKMDGGSVNGMKNSQ
ncbi:MAG: lasso peptide [Gemmatimonadales bacterium]